MWGLADSCDKNLWGLEIFYKIKLKIEKEGKQMVNGKWVNGKSERLVPRQVRLGECNYDYIEVIEGLEEGEQVVVSDMSKYKGKEKLKVKSE